MSIKTCKFSPETDTPLAPGAPKAFIALIPDGLTAEVIVRIDGQAVQSYKWTASSRADQPVTVFVDDVDQDNELDPDEVPGTWVGKTWGWIVNWFSKEQAEAYPDQIEVTVDDDGQPCAVSGKPPAVQTYAAALVMTLTPTDEADPRCLG